MHLFKGLFCVLGLSISAATATASMQYPIQATTSDDMIVVDDKLFERSPFQSDSACRYRQWDKGDMVSFIKGSSYMCAIDCLILNHTKSMLCKFSSK